ncbi:hypothetical protein C2E23DRAFT_728480 [Lenzites betulinus]|nr:hypothetical protein C2E23DRAFT_728480 [Lenzites betulinus]
MALTRAPVNAELTIRSGSRLVVEGLTTHLLSWEREGCFGRALPRMMKDAVAALRKRSKPTYLEWVKGHAEDGRSEWADRLAHEGATAAAPQPQEDMKGSDDGAALAVMTQRRAYCAIMSKKATSERPATLLTMDAAVRGGQLAGTAGLTAGALWKAIRGGDVRRTIRDFWWRALHGALRVGRYWAHIPGYEVRATCGKCGGTETLEHILTSCRAAGQATVWEAVRYMIKKKGLDTPELSYGTILAGPALRATIRGRAAPASASRLLRILVTESCHLVWALRCERVIEREGDPRRHHSRKEIETRWLAAMQKRLQMDQALTRAALRAHSIKRGLVLGTWAGLLQDELALPDDWIGLKGVLVGKPTCWTGAG